jgi:hypothetical protein
MWKLGLTVAVLGALAIALPSIASADTVKNRYHHPIDTRAKYRVHRHYGLHEGWRNDDRRVVIKHHHDPHHHMILD